jgi:hypothetical protein
MMQPSLLWHVAGRRCQGAWEMALPLGCAMHGRWHSPLGVQCMGDGTPPWVCNAWEMALPLGCAMHDARQYLRLHSATTLK